MDVDQDVSRLIEKYKDVLGKHYTKLKEATSSLRELDPDEAIAVSLSENAIRDILRRLDNIDEEDAEYFKDMINLAKEHKQDKKDLVELKKILDAFVEKNNDELAKQLSEKLGGWIDALETRKRPLIAYLFTVEEGRAKPEEESPVMLIKLFNDIHTLFEDYEVYPEHKERVERGRRILQRFGERFDMYGLGKVYEHWTSRHRVK